MYQPTINMNTIIFMLSMLLSVIIAQNIEWFKGTSHHNENIANLQNGWTECPDWNILSIKQRVSFEGVEQIQLPPHNNTIYNITALCINLKVPLNWDLEANDTQIINYFITRIFSGFNANNTKNNGAFWMLQGGPGSSGVSLYPFTIPMMNFMDNEFDIYLPDQRGTGYSSYLSPTSTIYNNFLDFCFDDGDYNNYFSPYSHAMDLGYSIDLFQNNLDIYTDDNDIILGVSYGTYYLNQYLILFPDQVNAAIFDGVSVGEAKFHNDKDLNEVGLLFMEKCMENEFCRGKFAELDTTILSATQNIIDQLDGTISSSECVQTLDVTSAAFKKELGDLLRTSDKIYIPYYIYVLYRCNDDDLLIINDLPNNIPPLFKNDTSSDINSNLLYNIFFSETWSVNLSYFGPSHEELVEEQTDYVISGGVDPYFKTLHSYWIRNECGYKPNELVYNKYADPQIPILIINGDMDTQTNMKYALHLADKYGANIDDVSTLNDKDRYFITFPNVPHGVTFFSFIKNFTDTTPEYNHDFETCGFYVIKSFIDPNGEYLPNMDCINWLKDIDWTGTDYYAQRGVDIWGNVSATDNDNLDNIYHPHK